MSAEAFLADISTQKMPLETDKLAFECFKQTWAKLRFSLLHQQMGKEEFPEEYY